MLEIQTLNEIATQVLKSPVKLSQYQIDLHFCLYIATWNLLITSPYTLFFMMEQLHSAWPRLKLNAAKGGY